MSDTSEDHHQAQSNAIKDEREKPVASPAKEVPDGGLVAWLQVAGAFSLFFNSW